MTMHSYLGVEVFNQQNVNVSCLLVMRWKKGNDSGSINV